MGCSSCRKNASFMQKSKAQRPATLVKPKQQNINSPTRVIKQIQKSRPNRTYINRLTP